MRNIPMIKSYDILGYAFNADIYCDGICILLALGEITQEQFDAATYTTDVTVLFNDCATVEGALTVIAARRGIDRSSDFDSSEFPYVIFGNAEYPDYCPRCSVCTGVLEGFDAADYETETED